MKNELNLKLNENAKWKRMRESEEQIRRQKEEFERQKNEEELRQQKEEEIRRAKLFDEEERVTEERIRPI